MINNNRQAGRRRGRGGQQQRPQGNGARDNGNRIDNRSRGNAAQLLEKYKSLARDAQQAGDRVNTEYFLQFADHYFRVLAETRSRFEENRTPMQGGANTFQDDEQDYNDDGEPVARAEQPRQNEGVRVDQQRQDGNRQDGNRQDGNRQDGNRDGNRAERDGNRQNGQQGYQGERQQNGQDRAERTDRPERQDRQANRGDRPDRADDRPRGLEGERIAQPERNRQGRERYQNERPQDEPVVELDVAAEAALEPVAPAPAPVEEQPQAEAPRRRGRPRREPLAEAPEAFEADRLPPSLTIPASAPVPEPALADGAGEPEEKPRRRRGRPPASEATTA